MQLIWTVRSHRVAVTACDSASRCHRVAQLGHTDRVWIYIPTSRILEISLKPFRPCLSNSANSRSPNRLLHHQWPPATGLYRRQRNLRRHCRRSEFTTELGYELDPFVQSLPLIPALRSMPWILPRLRYFYPIKNSFRLVLIWKLRVRFPPNSSRTDRVVEIGLTDLA
jgi:hypothetical protein